MRSTSLNPWKTPPGQINQSIAPRLFIDRCVFHMIFNVCQNKLCGSHFVPAMSDSRSNFQQRSLESSENRLLICILVFPFVEDLTFVVVRVSVHIRGKVNTVYGNFK